MDKVQELEWLEAQKIVISNDLVAVAEQQIEFLAAVDRRRSLYDGPVLDRAIHRYKTCWLPLLAKHTKCGVFESSLVVPLDCEWIWHCHRLNPVQYKKDCEKFYGRILSNQNVESSLHAKSKHQTKEMWAKLYPAEPFDLDCSSPFSVATAEMYSETRESITYDLVSAVKRQSSFYYQVARPSMNDNRFLEGAVMRYKGFLHLIKRNQDRSIKRFCVPTYDIDLIWHSHQLQPESYCKDLLQLLGKILEHDDTDADRSKGKKLDVGFSETTKQWEDLYGLRYWRAGGMYRGSMPSPLDVVTPYLSSFDTRNEVIMERSQKLLHLQKTTVVEVLLEIVNMKNFSASKNDELFVTVSKKQSDTFFCGSCTLSILSECGQKQVVGFQCEPKGELVLALVAKSNPAKTIGTASIPFEDLMDDKSVLSFEEWFELKLRHGNLEFKPVSLRVAASFTVPLPAPRALHMFKPRPISMSTCFFPLSGKVRQICGRVGFVDDDGSEIISLQMRNLKEKKGISNKISKRDIVGVTRLSRKPLLLAEYAVNAWSLKDYNLSLSIKKENVEGGRVFELTGDNQIKLFPGKKLEYEPKNCNQVELDFITAVEFSSKDPYGRAVALLDTKSSLITVNEEWFVLPAILLLFILKKEGFSGANVKQIKRSKAKTLDSMQPLAVEPAAIKGGRCGGGCGGRCGNVLDISSSGGCGDMATNGESGGCGGGCSGGCGNMATNEGSGGCGSGCGGGCGGGCGNMATNGGSGGCVGGCGSRCGNMMKSNGHGSLGAPIPA